MPLQDDPQKVDFLHGMVKNIKLQETLEVVEEEKQRKLQEVLGSLTAEDKAALRKQMTFTIKDRAGNKVQSMAEGGQIDSLEAEEARLTQGLSAEQHGGVGGAWGKVTGKLDALRSATVMVEGDDGKLHPEPLFDADELRTEFFEPLVREGLIPETLVPDEYSATQRLLDNAMEAYQETLKAGKARAARDAAEQDILVAQGSALATVKRGGAETKAALLRKFGPAGGGTEAEKLADLTGFKDAVSALYSTKSAMSAVAKLMPAEDVRAIEGILNPKVIAAELYGGPMLAGAVIAAQQTGAMPTGGGDGESGGIVGDATSFAKDAGKAVSGFAEDVQGMREVGAATAVGGGVGGAAGEGIEIAGAVDRAMFAKSSALKAAEPARLTGAAAETIAAVGQSLIAAVSQINAGAGKAVGVAWRSALDAKTIVDLALVRPAPNAQGVIDAMAAALQTALASAVAEPPEVVAKFRKAGTAVATAFKAGAKAPALTAEIRANPDTAFAALEAAGSAAVAKVLAAVPATAPSGDASADPDAVAGREFKEMFDTPAVAEKITKQGDARVEKEALDDLAQTQEQINATERQLTMINDSGALLAEQRTIAKLIDELKTDRAILSMAAGLLGQAAQLSKAGVKGAAADVAEKAPSSSLMTQVAPALNAIGLTAKLVGNIIKAAERWSLWYKFKAKLKMAKAAGSALAPAIENFYNNKAEQVTYHTIEDALLVAQIVGSVGTASGLAAPIGAAIQKVAEAGQSINKAVYADYNLTQLRAAWKKTKQAMQNPANRKVGLQAQLGNPTLAMHAIVWAGLEERDPIARNMMDACGLNEQSLDGDDASPGLVRQYLETLLAEDRKMLEARDDFLPEWQPKALDLSRKCWLICKQRAETKAAPQLKPAPTAAIDAALKAVEKQTLAGATPEQLQEYQKEAAALTAALSSYLPISSEGKKHDEMAELVQRLARLAEQRGAEIAAQLAAAQSGPASGAEEPTAPATEPPPLRRRSGAAST